ncbi:hypothetical protein QYE76_070824 [Lolium multiflorum]|uniref:Transposase (putative) gypsy type domain-containing protein n=1 Tax=Lolium multiflorum TaxID=4521 RepID=A0AAD8SK04_LOLMU|nr:hypothetical protein QYE76_070824 [Lolium multiflorum]
MVKKRNLAAASSTSGGAAAKASSNLPKRSAPDAPPLASTPSAPPSSVAVAKPGDWLASSITKRDEKRARSLGLISSDEENVILPGAISRPNPPAGFIVMFLSFLYRGLSLPAHEFLHSLLRTYEIQLWQLAPNSILHVAVFITLCEAFLGIEPHFGLWKKIFFVKRYSSSNGPFVIGGVGFVVRSEVNYFSFPMRESVQGWRLKWFYVKDSSTTESQLPRFADVLEAKPRHSWKNILSPDEKTTADKLFAKFLRIKESDGQTMIGTEVAAVFLKRRVQPIMARVRPMWLYSCPKDETRINIAKLSEKELLDEVRRLTLFSQEDSIPLISSYSPLDADHPLTEIPIVSENLHDLPNDTSEGRGSSTPVDFHTAEHDDPIDSEAVFADPSPPANDTCDTAGSVRDDDADHDAFINAAVEEVRAPPVKRSTVGFADEDDLFDLDEGLIEPPPKKAKSDAALPDVAASEASAPTATPRLKYRLPPPFLRGRIFLRLSPPQLLLQEKLIALVSRFCAETQLKIPELMSKGLFSRKNHGEGQAGGGPRPQDHRRRGLGGSAPPYGGASGSPSAPSGLLRGFDLTTHGVRRNRRRHPNTAAIAKSVSGPKLRSALRRDGVEEIIAIITTDASPSTSHVSPSMSALQEVDSLKEELSRLKEKLKEEEASRLVAEARVTENDEFLRQSSLALLEAADIPADAFDKVPNNSPTNSVSMTLAAHQLTRELLDKGKGAMARMHSMIFDVYARFYSCRQCWASKSRGL